MVLAKKLGGKLAKTIIAPAEALENSGVSGRVLSYSASWHRTYETDEKVDMANFEFLVASGGKPFQVQISYEKGQWSKDVKDIESELGSVAEEEEFVKSLKLLTDAEILAVLEKTPSIRNFLRRAPHLRAFSMSFVLYDDEFEAPIWRVMLKNWPLTNYFKKEVPITIEAIVEGMRGRVVSARRLE